MIRPAIELRSKFAEGLLEHLCATLEQRRHPHGWYIDRDVADARADIAALMRTGIIKDVEKESEK